MYLLKRNIIIIAVYPFCYYKLKQVMHVLQNPGTKDLVLVLIATLTSLQAPLEINALLQQFSSHSLAVFRPAHNLLCTRRKKKDL